MKGICLLILLPLYSFCQTVHVKDDAILYEGKVKLQKVSSEQTFQHASNALGDVMEKYGKLNWTNNSGNLIRSGGEIKLEAPREMKRFLIYSIEIKPEEDGYSYRIDSVFLREQIRGKKAKLKSSKEVLEGMEEAGKSVIETEKILNEIDMRFQKILAVLQSAIRSKVE